MSNHGYISIASGLVFIGSCFLMVPGALRNADAAQALMILGGIIASISILCWLASIHRLQKAMEDEPRVVHLKKEEST